MAYEAYYPSLESVRSFPSSSASMPGQATWQTRGTPPPPGYEQFQTLAAPAQALRPGDMPQRGTPQWYSQMNSPNGYIPSYGAGGANFGFKPDPMFVGNSGYGGGTAISGSGAPVGGSTGAGGGIQRSGPAPQAGSVPAAPDAAYKRYLDLLMNPAQAFQNPEYQAILKQGTDALGKSAANSRMRFAGKTAADFQTLGQRTAANYLGQISGQLGGAAQEERARYGADLAANNQGFTQTLAAWNAQQAAEQQDYARRLSEWSNYTGIPAR